MSRNPLLLAIVLTAVAIAAGSALTGPPRPSEPARTTVAEVRGAPAPSLEATAAEAPDRQPLIEPVEIPAASAPAGPPPVELLRAWDAARAEAWARGDPRLLSSLYTPGSAAGRRDRAMLRAWSERGLVVRDLRTQLLSVRELSHTPSTWTLRVTDRLAGGTAVGEGVRRPLPTDAATTRTVELRLVGGRWRIAAVAPG
jgi:hypothetical protein